MKKYRIVKSLEQHYKTAAIQPLTSHLTNHSRKSNKTCWALLKREKQMHKLCSPMYIVTTVLTDQQKITFSANIGVAFREPTKRDGLYRWMWK